MNRDSASDFSQPIASVGQRDPFKQALLNLPEMPHGYSHLQILRILTDFMPGVHTGGLRLNKYPILDKNGDFTSVAVPAAKISHADATAIMANYGKEAPVLSFLKKYSAEIRRFLIEGSEKAKLLPTRPSQPDTNSAIVITLPVIQQDRNVGLPDGMQAALARVAAQAQEDLQSENTVALNSSQNNGIPQQDDSQPSWQQRWATARETARAKAQQLSEKIGKSAEVVRTQAQQWSQKIDGIENKNSTNQKIGKGLRFVFNGVVSAGVTMGAKAAVCAVASASCAAMPAVAGIATAVVAGAVIGVGAAAFKDFIKEKYVDKNKDAKFWTKDRFSTKKTIMRAASGAIGGVLGAGAIDGFESLKSAFNSVKGWLPSLDRDTAQKVKTAAQAASSAARVASASVAQAVTSSGAAQAVAVSTNDFINEVRRLQEKDQIRQAREQAARMAAKAKEAARRAWIARENAASTAVAQEHLKTEIKGKVLSSPVGGEAQPLPSGDSAPSTLTKGAKPILFPAASSVPLSPGAPVAAVDAAPSVRVADVGTPVADAGHAPVDGVTVSLHTSAGEVSGDPASVAALQQELAAAAAPAKQLPDGSILTAKAGVSTDQPKILPGGEVLRPTTGYPTGGDQLAHASGTMGRSTAFALAH